MFLNIVLLIGNTSKGGFWMRLMMSNFLLNITQDISNKSKIISIKFSFLSHIFIFFYYKEIAAICDSNVPFEKI